MKLRLHIGTEKSGSSFLQTLLALNREQLITARIFYPHAGKREEDMISGKISPGNGKDLYMALQEDDYNRITSLLKRYKEEAAKLNCEFILLSNENLIEPLSQENIFDAFKERCREAGIELNDILLVLRDPVDQALSLYKHRAKNGRMTSIKEWLKKEYHLPGFLKGFLSFMSKKSIKLSIRKYQKDASLMQQIMFIDWLQLTDPKIPYTQRVNPSLTISELLMLRIIGDKNDKWITPFYDKMINIPFKEKDKEVNLAGYYKNVIAVELSQYKKVWNKCNEYLMTDEKLDMPSEKGIDDLVDINETLSFSVKQVRAITDFLIEVKNERILIKKMIKKIKRILNN